MEDIVGGENSGSLAGLQAEIRVLGDTVKRHDKALFGNGTPGLVQTVARLEGVVSTMAKTVSLMEESTRQMERSAASMAAHTDQIAKSTKAAQARISDVEKLVKPLVNWKHNIILRLTTMGLTISAIFTVLWFLYENWDKIKRIFQ